MLAYLMVFAAFLNAFCLYNAFFFFLATDFANAFCFHAFTWFVDA